MQKLNFFLIVTTTAGLLGACGGAQSREPATMTVTNRSGRREVLRLRLHGDIRTACPSIQAPAFDFDSGDAEPTHRESVRPLANCMNDPVNQGRRFVLIGHTDPTGSANSNVQLGMERANAVRDLLVSFGVAADRLEPVSRGEGSSQGTTPDEWPAERRVEIEFAPRS